MADWLELNALVNTGGPVSIGDMRTALRAETRGCSPNARRETQQVQLETLASAVHTELQSRGVWAGPGYPFRLRRSSIVRAPSKRNCLSSTYAFCLMLSYLPWRTPQITGHFPERIFEEISCLVAMRYIGGEGVRFGWPRVRSVIPSKFEAAVDVLCNKMGEGEGYKAGEATEDENDASLDVVAWRNIDERSGKLLLFGACATGQNWVDKLNELQPIEFCQTYLRRTVAPTPTKAFFTPRVVPPDRWQKYSNSAGIMFDRCRVSAILPALPTWKRHGNPETWMETAMDRVRQQANN